MSTNASTPPLADRKMSEDDWNELLGSLQRGACVLILGPGAIVGPDGTVLHDTLCQLLAKELGQEVPDSSEKLFHLATQITQKRGWRKLLSDLTRKAYHGQSVHPAYGKLAQIPFHLLMSVSPDQLIPQAFEAQGIPHQFGYYNYKRNPELDGPPSKELPLIYNLFGVLEDEDSMVLTHESLFDFLFSILSTKRLPLELKDSLQQSLNLVFLGFDFGSWYLKILLRLFESHNKEVSYAHAWRSDLLRPDLRTLYQSELFKLDFVNTNITEFIEALHQRCESDGLLREVGEGGGAKTLFEQVSDLLKKGEVEGAIDFLDNLTTDLMTKSGNNDLFTEVVLLSRRHNGLISQQNKGTISTDNAKLELNQIVDALLGVAQSIDES
ncbi:MAG: SIR2 family protein [Bacteroidota bacterium]